MNFVQGPAAPAQHDYAETRRCMLRAVEVLDRARRLAGQTNLPPGMNPGAVRAQIDDVSALLAEVEFELARARSACVRAGRASLTLRG